MTIKTPPLSPKRDVNIMSPSPLRISDNTSNSPGKANTMQGPIEDASSDKENDHGNATIKENNHGNATIKDKLSDAADSASDDDEEQDEDGVDPMMNVQSLFQQLLMEIEMQFSDDDASVVTEGGTIYTAADRRFRRRVMRAEIDASLEEGRRETRAEMELEYARWREEDAAKEQEQGLDQETEDIKKKEQGPDQKFEGDSKVEEHEPDQGSSLGSQEKQQEPDQGIEDAASGSRYVSPSDALMSPCTMQLRALKEKKIARGSETAVKRLFTGGRIGKKDEKEKGIEKEGERDGDEAGMGKEDGKEK